MNDEPSSNFSDRKMTSGAQRILTQIRRRAAENKEDRPPLYEWLVQELLGEENRATEVLDLPTSTLGALQNHYSSDFSASEPFIFFEWQLTLLRHADRYAILSSVEAVTGTEHLLMSAMELDASTREVFAEHGVQLEDLVEKIALPDLEIGIDLEDEIQVKPAGAGVVDEPTLFRILDASANRCREGMRVVEDFVRFGLNESFLSRELKELRHLVTETLRHLSQEKWVTCRDTLNDVGTTTSTPSEAYRGTPVDVLRASMKRIEEALRSLEEYSKLIDADLSQRFEQSRYRFYTIEKAIETNFNSRERLKNRRLYLLVTAEDCRYGLETTVRDSIAKGVDIVQLREKRRTDRELLEMAKEVREWTYEQDALFIMNDRPDLAAACHADGVHLGQDDLSVGDARKIVGSQMLVGISTHNIEQAREAIYAGADYLGVGPTFPSQTKEFTDFAGLDFLSEVAAETNLPWFAIGGIDLSNLGLVFEAGAARIAVSATICAAPDPRGRARELASRLFTNAEKNVKM
ncbi:thiamine phosphate synthase [Thalassoglobus polymorphus]|uniref:Thiamine-phosphate synthase n=1 Tax=Thalassoglobus polymorphus TaxID=2527994 RepID=A0A517QTE5_9PLAN|nr:thiamine phosphate synthase [Thalassoglobus polymorphus]QDT34909.1 Thiamine-phosphate synthase [Thalassoglobus polymorphus]